MMKLDIQCSSCGATTQVDGALSGTSVACPTCTAPIEVPLIAEVVVDNPPQAPVPPYANPYANAAPGIPTESSAAYPNASPGPRSSDPALRMIIPIDRSIWAIAAGYLGLFALICFPAPIALIVGIVALRDINQSGGKKHGLGRAWFGIIMGALFTLILIGGIITGIVGSVN